MSERVLSIIGKASTSRSVVSAESGGSGFRLHKRGHLFLTSRCLLQKLTEVHVVGVTCAATVFPCLNGFKFQVCRLRWASLKRFSRQESHAVHLVCDCAHQVVLLDECSQMTEPVSMLPVARFQCQRLVLVGDPRVSSFTLVIGCSFLWSNVVVVDSRGWKGQGLFK